MLRGSFLVGCIQILAPVASAQVQRVWLTHRRSDPNSVFLAGRDNYVLLTFRGGSDELVIDLKALDGTILDRTRYRGLTRHGEP